MSSFNESVGLGYLRTNAIEFVKYPLFGMLTRVSYTFCPLKAKCWFYGSHLNVHKVFIL